MTITRFDKKVLLSPPHMSGTEMKYIQRAFNDNFVVPLGPNVDEFENVIKAYLGKDDIFPVAMVSGTASIHIALRLLKVEPGEEIFCSSATFIASANPILYEKAVPVFIDSEPDTWNMCPKALLKAIEAKKRTKIPRILIVADLFGTSANYNEILDICSHFGIEVISDAAESLGSSYQNQKNGTWGRFGILSFNGNKIITTSGGGMLITHSKEEAEKAIFLITQARDKAPYYLHSEIGYNYRMSNICAGIGLGQMEVIDDRVKARRAIFERYKNNLSDSPLIFIDDIDGYYSNKWLTTALIDISKSSMTPSELIKGLADFNIEARHVWNPLHKQPIFANCEFYSIREQPIAEKIFNEGICLPSGSSMSEETQKQICNILKRILK